MKLPWAFALASLYSLARATRVGHVYLYDPIPKSSPKASSSVDPETARLIVAQRLGVSRFHSIKNPSEEAIQQINAFGASQQKLFDDEYSEKPWEHMLIWVDDVEDVAAIIKNPSQWTSSFTISTPPLASENGHLVEDLFLQVASLYKKANHGDNMYAAATTVDANHLNIDNLDMPIIHMGGKHASYLSGLLEELRLGSPRVRPYSLTVVVMPPSSSDVKRTAGSWGSYDTPSKLQPRRQLTEAPLRPSTAKLATSPISDLSDPKDFVPTTQAEGNNTTPPLGILPSCFDELSKCEEKTHGCSGHGECRLRRKGGSDRSDCYACTCTPDVVHVGDKGMESRNKTTYWGGPACQKKDVSVPFWLFVASGVLITFLITTGIGMLYSVGNEELPSVIGAGVSGPVRK